MQAFKPAEIIFSKTHRETFQQLFQPQFHHHMLQEWVYYLDYAQERLNQHFGTATLKGFGIADLHMGIIAAGAVLHYLEETHHHHLKHINTIRRLEQDHHLWLDKFTVRNLELVQAQQEEGRSLIQTLDNTTTPMGARLLRKWIRFPLKQVAPIQKRLNAVAQLVNNPLLSQNLLQELKQIGDLERIISKVAAKRVNPREMLALKKALQHTLPIQQLLEQTTHQPLAQLGKQLHTCKSLLQKIHNTLNENPPIATNQANLIKQGYNTHLDQLRQIAFESKHYLDKLVSKERQNTGISTLKIGYNKVFGFYLEVTNKQKHKIPPEWIRKQTLVNAERYVTQQLKTYEEKILHAQEKICTLEQQLYQQLVEAAVEFVPQIQQNARTLAQLDCYNAFAQRATKHHYTQPTINDKHLVDIKAGRHPVIEQHLPHSKTYVPNDIYLDHHQQQILLITGPNMAGKSALLRQVALTVLMAQIGSFVPAKQATIGVVDKIFTRVGATDNLAMSESTFMVEMNEMASIINNLSNRSLVIIDELGRGTGTADGFSLAQATIEHLHNHPTCQPKTLFATHYHELNQLASKLKRVKNFHVAVAEVQGKVIFLHQLKPGSTPHSFGIQVARMAGIPLAIIQRAQQILTHLTTTKKEQQRQKALANIPPPSTQLNLFGHGTSPHPIVKELRNIEISTLAPVEALLKLEQLKHLLKKHEKDTSEQGQ